VLLSKHAPSHLELEVLNILKCPHHLPELVKAGDPPHCHSKMIATRVLKDYEL